MTRSRRTLTEIFAIPAILGALSIGGLVFALVEDGMWDALSWIALAVPIVLYAVCIARGRCPRTSSPGKD